MNRSSDNFKNKVYRLMSQLPEDCVTTYGDIAAACGHPRAARQVGGLAHFGPVELPWHRLVNGFGGLARGFPGGPEVQEQLLAQDGIECQDGRVIDFEGRRWKVT